MPLELVARSEERRVRAAVAEWHAETLRVADRDVGAPFTGRREQGQGQQVGGGSDEGTGGVRLFTQRSKVTDGAVRCGILQQRADHVALVEIELVGLGHDDVEAARRGPRPHHRDRLRMAIRVDEVHELPLVLGHRLGQMHRLGGGSALIEQRRIGDFEAGQVRHHRLKIEQCLEPALCDLRLVRRVGRVPAGILQHVPLNHGRRDAVVVSHSQVGAEHLVLRRQQAQLLERFVLRLRGGNPQRITQADIGGDERVDERIERVISQRAQHRRLVLGRRADVPVLK